MRNLILLVAMFVFVSCASPEYKALRQEVLSLAPKVEVLKSDSNKWCKIEDQCEFIRNLNCGGITENECLGHLRNDTVKLGGDTIIVHEKKLYYGYAGKVLVLAQAYNCSNKFTEFGMRYQNYKPSRPQKVRYLSDEYAKKCGTKEKCKSISPFECSDTNWGPARTCLNSLAKRYSVEDEVNTLVFEKETFNQKEDNGRYQRGDYLLSGQTYSCKLN